MTILGQKSSFIRQAVERGNKTIGRGLEAEGGVRGRGSPSQ